MDDFRDEDDLTGRKIRRLTWAGFTHEIRRMVDNDPSILVQFFGGLAMVGVVFVWGAFFT